MKGIVDGWAAGPDGWFLTPEGAIVRPDQGLLVVSDLHLGYEASRGADFLPDVSGGEIRGRLLKLFNKSKAKKLVVAGDLVESRVAVAGTKPILDRFLRWVKEQGVEIVLLAGNHDPVGDLRFSEYFLVDGWLIHHGDKRMGLKNHNAKGWVIGHWHPALHWRGRNGRVFLTSSEGIVTPAFTSDAAGVDVLSKKPFQADSWGRFRCHVCLSNQVLDFGLLGELQRRMSI